MKPRNESQKVKAWVCMLALVLAGFLVLPCLEAQIDALSDTSGDTDTGRVAEIQSQDSAFSLLLEAYRQFQSYIIQRDYQAQLAAARQLPGIFARREAVALAKQERQLRVNRLGTQLVELSATYGYARQREERADCVDTPCAVNPADASEKLHDFVVIAPDPRTSDGKAVQTIPVTTLLRGGQIAPEPPR